MLWEGGRYGFVGEIDGVVRVISGFGGLAQDLDDCCDNE